MERDAQGQILPGPGGRGRTQRALFSALRGFRVFGRTLRDNQNLTIAAGPDAHRGQCAFIAQRHMDDPAISGIHGIKGHGAAGLPRATRRAFGEPSERIFPISHLARHIDDDSRRIVERILGDLVCKQLESINGPTVAPPKPTTGWPRQLIDEKIAL